MTIALSGVRGADGAPAFGLNIAPVLTGAGIVGLAVGFGAQTLVRDIISGFFLILEDQVRVGDVAAINGTGGLVEAINLRTIVLRDGEGTVHVFPNGAITTLANRSKDFSYYVIDLGISYREDPDRVAEVLRETGGRAAGGSRLRSVHPRADRDPGRRRVPRLVGAAEAADQDRAAQAVGGRPRVAEADPSARSRRQGIDVPFPVRGVAAERPPQEPERGPRGGSDVSSPTAAAAAAGFCPFDSCTILTPALAPTRVAPAATIALQPFEIAHAAGRLDAHLGADDPPHQRDVGGRRAAGTEAGRRLHEVGARGLASACRP